jgi:hypothetical protein
MGFVRVASSVVQHTDGYKVYVSDRLHVAYEEHDRVAQAEVTFGIGSAAVHTRSLEWIAPEQAEPTPDEAKLILARISEGLKTLGDRPDLV